MHSEVVTWEACPGCDGPAAVGWVGRTVTEIDCGAGCRLTDPQADAVRRTATPPGQDRPERPGPQVPRSTLREPLSE